MAVAIRLPSAERRVLLGSGSVAAVGALLLLLVVPRGGDASAHLYRTLLVQHGALLWDNLWYAGQYPLVSYSLLYYLPAALVGNGPLATIAVVLSALLFASLVLPVYQARAARWPSYCFAVLVGGQFFTGDYPYTMGFAALLATLWALQRGRTRLAIVCAALTLGFSPLAFLFLCLTLLALRICSSQPRSRTLVVGGALVALAGLEFGALRLFHSPSLYYPFAVWRLAVALPVGLLGVALALRSRAARPFASIFIVWTLATVAAYLIPSPFGHNLLRPSTLVFPLMLLVAVLAGFRPRWLAYPAVVAAFAANVVPYVTTALARVDPAANASFWSPLLRYVASHSSASYRLEVVPTINHWEAFYVPKAGFSIARGWYEQLDTGDYPRLHRGVLTPGEYRDWLRSVGVRYVILAKAPLAGGAAPEARLVRSGQSGLARVFAGRTGSVYELRGAQAILTGPGRAAITRLGVNTLSGWTARRGSYLLRVHYTSLWRVRRGSVCLLPAPHRMTRLEAQRAGPFALQASEEPSTVVEMIFDRLAGDAPSCRSA